MLVCGPIHGYYRSTKRMGRCLTDTWRWGKCHGRGLHGTIAFMPRLFCASLLTALVVFSVFGQKKEELKTAQLNFSIIKDANGKPIQNAEIVLHPVDKTGKQKEEGLELKTHEDGKANIGGIPYGKMRVQVIAHGFRTYGEDYDIQQPTHEIIIKMQKPAGQYSIYK